MKAPQIIATHTNTDFDAFAAMVAAHKLYPEAVVCLGGAINRNVREFRRLYADALPTVEPGSLDLAAVRRLILLDTVHPNRLGELGGLCARPDVEVVVFDHHGGERPEFVADGNFIVSDDGSLVTAMLRIVAERRLPVTALEATVFALGIHEDTGSLSFATTTLRDAEALAFCMRQGADAALIERYLHTPLSAAQRDVLARALHDCEEIVVPGRTVLVAIVHQAEYVESVSVVAHAFMDLTDCDAFFLLVEMEQRLFVVARSRGDTLDVAQVLGALGGGGHATAASAVLRESDPEVVLPRLRAAIAAIARAVPTAADVMTDRVPVVAPDASVDEALVLCRRQGVAGVLVADGDDLVGTVTRDDLERAGGHRLSHAPVKAVMTARVTMASAAASLDELTRMLIETPLGWVPVARAGSGDPPRLSDIVGGVTRAAVVRTAAPAAREIPVLNVAERLGELGMDDLFAHIQAVGVGFRGVYLVGGAVRDLLLHERSIDIDIAVEGDGVEFAEELALRIKGKARAHAKFQTAVVIAPAGDNGDHLRVDVASTRTEFYDFPAALPKIEHAGIRSDLARRDFTVNAMAVSLAPESYGDLLDCFGGVDDLRAKHIVVLHNLSFIEDPTRILRAIRYETRYGLRMDPHTLNLARSCSDMDIVGDLSSARLRDELVLLLGEARVDFALQRLQELGLARSIHPRFNADSEARDQIRAGDAVWRGHALTGEVPLWRLRTIWLLRDLRADEILAWAGRMRLRRADADVVARALVVGRRLAESLRRGHGEAEVYDVAVHEPLEAIVAAIVLAPDAAAEERLGRFLDVDRHVALVVSGDDLIELGFESSPRLGTVLRALLHLKLSGVVSGRADELEAARRML
jgi:tRNA nucleotidyltransferase (CCA-adding enzyme)